MEGMSAEELETVVRKIVQAAYEVRKTLTKGYLEKVYQNALALEIARQGLHVLSEAMITVTYKGENVGEYRADLLVENQVIIEVKAIDRLERSHHIQLVNYLTATNLPTGLLINFGGDLFEVKRKFRDYTSVNRLKN